MTLWVSILKGLLAFFNSLFAYLSAAKAEELGRLKEAERNAQAADDLRVAIDRANADSVSDLEAFGPGRQDNNLPGSKP